MIKKKKILIKLTLEPRDEKWTTALSIKVAKLGIHPQNLLE